MKEKILNEIEYMLEKANLMLDITEKNKDKDNHNIALGQVMALNDLKYSIKNNDFLYEKVVKK